MPMYDHVALFGYHFGAVGTCSVMNSMSQQLASSLKVCACMKIYVPPSPPPPPPNPCALNVRILAWKSFMCLVNYLFPVIQRGCSLCGVLFYHSQCGD